jgi:hypothetical protein
MKIKKISIGMLLMCFISALPAQQATSWKNHPAIQQLKDSATVIFPDMPVMKWIVLALLMLAVAIWCRYFWVTWKEMRMQSLRQNLRKFAPPDKELSAEAPAEPSRNIPSLFKEKNQPTAPPFSLKAASDAPSGSHLE